MKKKRVNDLLLLAHKFLSLFEAVRFALDINDGAVMQNAIQDSGGNRNIGKDLVPLGEGLIGSEDGGGLLIAPGNQLEEKVGALDVHREIANLVNDQHLVSGEDFQPVRQAVLKMGL